MQVEFTLHDVKKALRNRVVPFTYVRNHERVVFKGIRTPEEARGSHITWLKEPRYTQAGLVITAKDYETRSNLVLTENPRIAMAIVMNYVLRRQPMKSIHETAIVHPDAVIGADVQIGAGCVIGKCHIGAGTRIYARCYIGEGTYIGRNCEIWHGAVIGSEGFGWERHKDKYIKFPSVGNVYIGDNCSIGANTCIDRGALSDTVIENGCKIDNLVHIAHNAHIGRNSVIIANAMIAGGVEVGRDTWIAPSANILNGLTVGGGAVVGMGANVLKDVPDNETWVGNPAKKLR
jgi:UDP-3-O-[3-hydroxymyristoyl] glucosamine N-acyltransferase